MVTSNLNCSFLMVKTSDWDFWTLGRGQISPCSMHIDVWTGRVYRGLAELPEFAQPRHPDHNAAQSLQMPWMGLCLFVCLFERENGCYVVKTFISGMKKKRKPISIGFRCSLPALRMMLWGALGGSITDQLWHTLLCSPLISDNLKKTNICHATILSKHFLSNNSCAWKWRSPSIKTHHSHDSKHFPIQYRWKSAPFRRDPRCESLLLWV